MNRFVALPILALLAASCGTKIDPVQDRDFGLVDVAPEGVTWCGDIEKLLARFCTSCHSSTLQGAERQGAPEGRNWDVYATTAANADLIQRMLQAGAMPPSGRLPDVDIGLFVEWTETGLKECGEAVSEDTTSDVPGPTEDGTQDEGPVTPTCSSGTRWTTADGDGPLMRPGENCGSCHSAGADRFLASGTVMGALHDEDGCNGVLGVVVEIKGSDLRSRAKTTNAAGNFWLSAGEDIALPYTARLSYQGSSRTMTTPQSDMNCANCHTVAGLKGAQGRIVAPAP